MMDIKKVGVLSELTEEELVKISGGSSSTSDSISTIELYINLDEATRTALCELNDKESLNAIAWTVMYANNYDKCNLLAHFKAVLLAAGISWTGGCSVKNRC